MFSYQEKSTRKQLETGTTTTIPVVLHVVILKLTNLIYVCVTLCYIYIKTSAKRTHSRTFQHKKSTPVSYIIEK